MNDPYLIDASAVTTAPVASNCASLKTYLSTDGYEDYPVKDPSSGDERYPETLGWLRDPSTGEIVTESIKVRELFAQDSSISFVDLD